MRPAGMTRFCVFLKSMSAVMVSVGAVPRTSAFFTGVPLSVIFGAFAVAKPMFLSKVTVNVCSPKSSGSDVSGVADTS